jgi:tRNA nucleotidyltransferase (CCA-adding enzyme)
MEYRLKVFIDNADDAICMKPTNSKVLELAAELIGEVMLSLPDDPNFIEIVVGGSFGKGTAISGKPADLDIAVVFKSFVVDKYSVDHCADLLIDKARAFVAALSTLLVEDITFLKTGHKGFTSLTLNVEGVPVEIDLLPAFDLEIHELLFLDEQQRMFLQPAMNRMQTK